MFKGFTAKDWIIGYFTLGIWILIKMYKNGAPFGKILGGFVGVVLLIGILGAIFGEKKPSSNNTETVAKTEVKVDNSEAEAKKKAEAERLAKEKVEKEKAEAERLAKEEEAKNKAEAERLAKEKSNNYKYSYELKNIPTVCITEKDAMWAGSYTQDYEFFKDKSALKKLKNLTDNGKCFHLRFANTILSNDYVKIIKDITTIYEVKVIKGKIDELNGEVWISTLMFKHPE